MDPNETPEVREARPARRDLAIALVSAILLIPFDMVTREALDGPWVMMAAFVAGFALFAASPRESGATAFGVFIMFGSAISTVFVSIILAAR